MITEQQRTQRQKHIGSSDVAALFTDKDGNSLDPFKTAKDVWVSKVYELENGKTSDACDRGNRWEPILVEYAAEQLGKEVLTEPEFLNFVSQNHPTLACNLDGITAAFEKDEQEIIEAKTSSLFREWGEPGTDEVPDRVILQVQQQMICSGLDVAHVVVLLGGYRLQEQMYRVERNEALINIIIERCEQFWRENVMKEIPPEDTKSGSLSVIKRIKRIPKKYIDINPELVLNWDNARHSRLEAEKAEKTALSNLLLDMKDAEGAIIDGEREFTYFQQKGKTIFDTKLLREKYPAIYEEITHDGNPYRIARIRKIN